MTRQNTYRKDFSYGQGNVYENMLTAGAGQALSAVNPLLGVAYSGVRMLGEAIPKDDYGIHKTALGAGAEGFLKGPLSGLDNAAEFAKEGEWGKALLSVNPIAAGILERNEQKKDLQELKDKSHTEYTSNFNPFAGKVTGAETGLLKTEHNYDAAKVDSSGNWKKHLPNMISSGMGAIQNIGDKEMSFNDINLSNDSESPIDKEISDIDINIDDKLLNDGIMEPIEPELLPEESFIITPEGSVVKANDLGTDIQFNNSSLLGSEGLSELDLRNTLGQEDFQFGREETNTLPEINLNPNLDEMFRDPFENNNKLLLGRENQYYNF